MSKINEFLEKYEIHPNRVGFNKYIKFFTLLMEAEEDECQQLKDHWEEMSELPSEDLYDFEYLAGSLTEEQAYAALKLLRRL